MIYLYLFGTCFHFIYVFMIIDNNQPIQPNTWISADIEVIPWEVIEEDHDL